ncbi:MAG TPA: sugar phosphate isomerase/epimerase [Chloroflexota bacterium]|jgi:inosose dehydratase|nr:sugar phosphate isomerase/epimerase [Chloroflexota bacterium]
MSGFKLGFAPITWNNEDLRTELGPFVPYETLLDEVVLAGYRATELGDGFPTEPTVLRRALETRGLAMPSAWCGLGFFQVSPVDDLEHTRRLCDRLAASGASYVNLAHYGSPARMAVACRAADEPTTPRLTPSQWDELADRVCQTAEIARQAGLQATFHLHAGTWIETRAELTELLARAPAPLVKLCWDVGHAICGGIDPVEVVRAYPERIAYLHLKDVDGDVLAGVRREGVPFADAVRRRVFTELGRGILDVPGLLAALTDIGYEGWLMIEQDSTWLAPIESARTSRAYLASLGV